jgi:glucose/arabinose dehydrogenase
MNNNFVNYRFVVMALSLFFFIFIAASHSANADETVSKTATAEYHDDLLGAYATEDYLKNLSFPKSIALLSNDTLLVAQRDGSVEVFSEKQQRQRFPLNLPSLYTEGQGGLLDLLVIDEKVTSNGAINEIGLLVSYSKGNEEANKLAVVQTHLSLDAGFSEVNTVFEVNETKDTPVHYGGKLLALRHGGYLVTSGDGFDYREKAQIPASHLGKVLGFTLESKPLHSPPLNIAPFIFTLGHRNPQGLAYGADGNIYLNEHGPDGGDELNRLTAGANYGWPVVTLGKDYSGANITPFTQYVGMQDPLINWTPSIAPSSMALYDHTAFSRLQNAFLITSLKAKQLFAVDYQGETFTPYAIVNAIDERLRDVEVDSQGNILLLTDGESAKVVKITSR